MIPKLTDTIKHIIIINFIMFVFPMFLNMDLTNITNLHFPLNDTFGIWQCITSMFMHGSWGHLLFNMLGLWMFGSALEQFLGAKRFLFLYLSAGIGASLIYTLIDYYQFNEIYSIFNNAGLNKLEIINILDSRSTNDQRITGAITQEQFNKIVNIYHKVSLGASGAVFGIFAASATFFPKAKILVFPIPFPIPLSMLIISLVVSDFFIGTFSLPGDNVARFAHVAGAAIGFIIAWYWKKNK
ncbi:rhomboid family intramembrane serine protease [Tenacibaculum retecalamus]|uniref:rhomboid family intramembrane serine protease n=1 Tax=Tenacibaculum retecalamus TaxID=3018315 RepID=UPI0023D90453|nr:rhomboid family intramembrane serine protease [Tenacibaculum retecalamus]WBX71961.1 rhomboid family intramembrane serine protease [Tenacibaculum retecalamus]